MALGTNLFVIKMIERGYTHCCVVPCSFASNLINAIINSGKIEYLPCASEAVACSVAAGLKITGKKPFAVIQSSGLTNMGSCMTSLLTPYNISFPILTSWRTYKEGDSEIQHKHLATKLPSLVEAYGYRYEILDATNPDAAIAQVETANIERKIIILEHNTFDKVLLNKEHQLDLSSYPKRSLYLEELNSLYADTDTIFIGTTGNTAREMYHIMSNTKNFYMAGNMGGALSLGLGMAKSGKKVIVCGGDAEFVMHMGGLTTAGRYIKNTSLTYVLFDNESNKSTGGQKTYQEHIDYIGIAKASGFDISNEIVTTTEAFKKTMIFNEMSKGIKFVHVKCSYDDEMARPPLKIVEINQIN